PDGKTVLAAGGNQARLWQAATGSAVGTPLQHPGKVLAAAFSPDGNTVLTGRDDHTARPWAAAAGPPLGLPFQPQRGAYRGPLPPANALRTSSAWPSPS